MTRTHAAILRAALRVRRDEEMTWVRELREEGRDDLADRLVHSLSVYLQHGLDLIDASVELDGGHS